jgi:murein DD-endopeptidase MepM/ murein hydrolase activator NlpD
MCSRFEFVLFCRRGSSLLLLLSVVAAPSTWARDAWAVRWQPARLVNGSPVVFRVSSPDRLDSLSGKWLEHDVFFSFDPASKTWYAIAGVSLETKPGKYSLALSGKTAKGREVSFQRSIAVGKGKYQQIAVTVAKQYTEPSPEQLQEINQDKTLKQQVFAHVEPEREWAGKFLPPVDASISDVFGTARTFNGKVQSVHQGLDFRVSSGTPVDALNAGTVLLARPLFFEGGCVVLDHGQGLMTIYMHLSEMKVKEGEQVKRGQEIALSGGTGRATGPHLHVAVRWQGVYLDPKTLLSLNLP